MKQEAETRVPVHELGALVGTILQSVGARPDIADAVRDALIQTSLRGVDTHGVALLPQYVKEVKAGRLNPDPRFHFERTGAAVGLLNADDTFGQAAALEGMKRAVGLAQETGMGMVAVAHSSHFGAAATYSLWAAERDCIGIAMTHADSRVLASGGRGAYFGTNPICIAAPVWGEDPWCLDMATSLVTWNRLRKAQREGLPIPSDWGVDERGDPVADPARVACLLPLGGYKGFGLGMAVDILCSLLTGMPFGKHISGMYRGPIGAKRKLGHIVLAVNIGSFTPVESFKRRLKAMMDEVRAEPPLGAARVMVPGDPEKASARDRERNGIPLSQDLYRTLVHLGAEGPSSDRKVA